MRTQAHRIVDTDPKRGNVVVRVTGTRHGVGTGVVLLGIGLIIGASGLTQRAWAQLVIGAALMAVSQIVKPKDTDTGSSIKNSG
ncbi:hypothetical protein ACIPUC_14265 [Streptomyces sp. LARHCF249]